VRAFFDNMDNSAIVFNSDDASRAVEALKAGDIPILPESAVPNL
jgi:hypothetical protein